MTAPVSAAATTDPATSRSKAEPPDPDTLDPAEAVAVYALWHFDCPACGLNVEIDHDPSGEAVQCDACDEWFAVASVR